MHLFGTLGTVLVATGSAFVVISFIMRRLISDYQLGTPFIAGLVLTIGSFQLSAFGIMTELQIRTCFESQGKKPYRVRTV